MKSTDIRSAFLRYFEKQGHKILPSSSLVPNNDPTLLFTNAGMVQFKNVFLGKEKPVHSRVTTSQRCVRAGGKHNDLENVGYTARHHTFFEMLGNFSFGDYFKREAIHFAWQFLTKELKIPAEKLWVTVFKDDNETADIWLKEMGVSAERFSRCGEDDNFWVMGDVGPCGPCTEIFYDHGPEIAGGPPGSPDQDGDRYVEIWNLVFMQFNRAKDGELTPLPQTAVDTGMGLERISAVLQGVHSNYDIDLFQHLIHAAADVLHVKDLAHTSLKVIADHIRSTAFLIVDGVVPGNEGRNYVLRRIIRRAVRHGHRLGARNIFFYRLVQPLIDVMGKAYPELSASKAMIEKILKKEEQQFAKTLEQGLKILEQDLEKIAGKTISGETVFRLYDTYGFPVDLTADIAREKKLEIDLPGFEVFMEKQKTQSKAAGQFSAESMLKTDFTAEGETMFCGYDHLASQAKIVALYDDVGKLVSSLKNQPGMVVLDKTPFYAEGGGQVGDRGRLHFKTAEFVVRDTQKSGDAFLHVGELRGGELHVGDQVQASVDAKARRATELNHSATHLLHAVMQKVLGAHVHQKGSLVEPARLRFDFTHPCAVTPEELLQLERSVNHIIRQNDAVTTKIMSSDEAIKQGAAALFGEKYGDKVRVLSMGDFSKELCGGTHVKRTGDIAFFKIVSETGVAAGIRRIEAVTGEAAEAFVQAQMASLNAISGRLRTSPEKVLDKLEQLLQQQRQLEKTIEQYKSKMASATGSELLEKAVDIQGVKVLSVSLDGVDNKVLRETVDTLKNKLGKSVVVLAAVNAGKVQLVAGVAKDLTSTLKAGELVNQVASYIGGRGGGRPDMAQAGGEKVEALPEALASVYDWVKKKLSVS